MRKLPQILYPLLLSTVTAFGGDGSIWGKERIVNILTYGKEGSTGLGPTFVDWQGHGAFAQIMGWVLLIVLVVFLLHYLIIGPKRFEHGGTRIRVFSLFQRVIHWMAALAFVLLIPTGLMILYGKYLGGGSLVLTARYIHDWATVLFAVSVIPMFLFWLVAMLPTWDDVKWLFIAGGYLSKKKREVPAGKFNAGQKMWFWLATLGGAVMIATGAAMYLQEFDFGIASTLGLSQIDLLRLAAITHNVLAFAIVALFITHLYMSIFAIKGSLQSMIDGHKEEDEVKHLHSSWYKKLKKEGKV
jgi:formate dehydrogenase subunit gamma